MKQIDSKLVCRAAALMEDALSSGEPELARLTAVQIQTFAWHAQYEDQPRMAQLRARMAQSIKENRAFLVRLAAQRPRPDQTVPA